MDELGGVPRGSSACTVGLLLLAASAFFQELVDLLAVGAQDGLRGGLALPDVAGVGGDGGGVHDEAELPAGLGVKAGGLEPLDPDVLVGGRHGAGLVLLRLHNDLAAVEAAAGCASEFCAG